MTESEALEKVNELHSKIVRSPFAKNVTESEMLAFIKCKKALENQEKIKEAFEKWKADTSGIYGADDETIILICTLKRILRRDEE